MIIDFHVHAFPDAIASRVISKLEGFSKTRAFTDGSLGGLQAGMQGAQIDYSVVQPVATAVEQVITCNDFAAKINETYSDIISFGAMHPDFADYKAELARIKAMGIKGIKLHPNYQATYFDDIRYKRIIDAASALDLIVLTHAGIDVGLADPTYLTPKIVKGVIRDLQPPKLVLAHMGGWQMWEDVLEELAGEQVYLDTAFCLSDISYIEPLPEGVHRYTQLQDALFVQLVQALGADKVLFGTDSPWSGQAACISAVRQMPLTDAQKTQILGENAKALLGMPQN